MEDFFQDFKDNLVDQYTKCPAYKLICDNQNFDPSANLICEKDIENVPFIATTLFKKSADIFTQLLRVPVDTIDKWTVSSSTSGDPSIVGRRMCDLMKIKEFTTRDKKTLGSHKSEVICGKNTESYIGNLLDIFEFKDSTIFLIKADGDELSIDINEFKEFLLVHDNMEHHLSIRGSTILFYNAVNMLKEKMPPLNLGKNALIHTGGGGWDGKKGTLSIGSALKRQVFVEEISSFLGVPQENFIDSYSFTENSFPITGHYSPEHKDYLFHVPKWGKVMIRDIKTLKPLYNKGDKGFIQMLNAYGTSTFAGASILVDDIGEIVSPDECPACKEGCMTIKILGRVKGAEAKGCGATLNVRSEE